MNATAASKEIDIECTEKTLTFRDLEIGEEFYTADDRDILYKKVKLWGYHSNRGESRHCITENNTVYPIDPSQRVIRNENGNRAKNY